MAINKVKYGDDTLIDLTGDTVSEDTLAKGVTAHNAAGLSIEGAMISGQVLYGTCSTSYSTAAKVVTCEDATELVEGLAIMVSFSARNTANAPTLNVNGLGAKNIYINGATASSSNRFLWAASTSILFIYDGSYWVPTGFKEVFYGTSSTAASTAAKTSSISECVLKKGTQVTISFTYLNTNASPTLNIGSMGAFSIDGGTNWATNGDYYDITFVFDGQSIFFVQEDAYAQSLANTAQSAADEAKAAIPTEVSELNNDVPYATSRELSSVKTTADEAYQNAESAQEKAELAQSAASTAQSAAEAAQRVADEAYQDASNKVASVSVGDIITGDTPNVVNSGTDKDVVFDFTFPESGSSSASVDGETLIIGNTSGEGGGADPRIVTGTFANNDYLTIPCSFAQVTYGGAGTSYMGVAIYNAGRIKDVSTANGFDVYAASGGVSIDNYSGAEAYYIAIIID